MPAAAWAQPWAEKTAVPFDRKLSPFSSLPQKPLSPALPTAAGRRKKGLLHWERPVKQERESPLSRRYSVSFRATTISSSRLPLCPCEKFLFLIDHPQKRQAKHAVAHDIYQ